MKKVLSAAFAALFLFMLVPVTAQAEDVPQLAPQSVVAVAAEEFLSPDATPSGNVAQRIEQVKALFKHGDYFSKNRQADPAGTLHYDDGSCAAGNCSVNSVLPTIPGFESVRLTPAATCLGFARFASFYIFGLCPNYGAGMPGYSSVSLANAKPGDFVRVNGKTHSGIFISQNATYVYLLDSNNYYSGFSPKTNRVSHNSPTPKSGNTFEVYRANNYDQINASASVPITSVSLNTTRISLKQGETTQLTAVVNPSNTTQNKTVTWTSSDPSSVSVSANGLVTVLANGLGSVTITAAAGGKSATCTVNMVAVVGGPVGIAPTDPANLRITKTERSGITLAWNDPHSGWSWGGYFFEIQRKEGGQWVTKALKQGPLSTYKDIDVRVGASYTYRIMSYFVNEDPPYGLGYCPNGSNTAAAKIATGWQTEGSKKYYYDGNGILQTGWTAVGSKWYFMDKSTGAVKKGWVKDGSQWFFLDKSSGAMRTGWVQDGGAWYFLDKSSGAMRTGWVQDGGAWYFLDKSSGAMRTGWLYDGGAWYYLDRSSGAMRTGWLLDGGHWYYLQPSGVMATGTAYIGGVRNRFNAGGVWLGAA